MRTAKKEDGGPAFPRIEVEHFPSGYGHGEHCETDNMPGMTLRDYFAGQAVIGLGSHKAVVARGIPWLVEHAYMVADAMLKERDK